MLSPLSSNGEREEEGRQDGWPGRPSRPSGHMLGLGVVQLRHLHVLAGGELLLHGLEDAAVGSLGGLVDEASKHRRHGEELLDLVLGVALQAWRLHANRDTKR